MALKSLGEYFQHTFVEVGLYPIELFFLLFGVGQETADTAIKSRLCSQTRTKH